MYFKKEESIREARTIEATRKRLMWPSGKIGCIVKNLGHPIIASGSSYYDVNEMEDPFKLHDPDELPSLGEDDLSHKIGWFFDGLNRGMNLEIKYLDGSNELTVRYNGNVVYQEVGGDLGGYAPFDDWEEKVEKLYEIAKQKENHTKKQTREKNQEVAKKRSKVLLEKMRKKWGI